PLWAARGAVDDQEARRVVWIVLDGGPQNRHAVELRRQVGRDRGDGDVGGRRLRGGRRRERLLGRDVGQVLGEPSPALRESLRVREHALDPVEPGGTGGE